MRNNKLLKSIFFLSLSIFLISSIFSGVFQSNHFVFADNSSQNISIKKEQITPDMETRYKFKRLIEKIEGLIADVRGKNAKVSYLTKLTDIRLSELYYLAGENKDSYIETSSSRYITTLGQLSETINGDKSYNDQVKKTLEKHPQILSNLLQRYQTGSSNWLLIKQSLDTANSVLSSLNN